MMKKSLLLLALSAAISFNAYALDTPSSSVVTTNQGVIRQVAIYQL